MKNWPLFLFFLLCVMTNVQSQETAFPTLKAETLSGQEITFPDDLNGEVNILILIFERQAQPVLNTWAGLILEEYEPQVAITYHGIPMMSAFYKPIGWQIDNWMRDGIPSNYHDNTATFYGNRKPYFKALDMPDKSTCYLFLLDRAGNIHYRDNGSMDSRKEANFRVAVTKLIKSDQP